MACACIRMHLTASNVYIDSTARSYCVAPMAMRMRLAIVTSSKRLHAGAKPPARALPVGPPKMGPAAQRNPAQATASPASKLRSKYGQLADLLQNTALQRGISLSQVPVPPTGRPGMGSQKRASFDEVRTSFRSFTTASRSAVSSSKPALPRRVSTGAITPAFLKEKNRQDTALLQSLGVAAAEVNGDAAANSAAALTWAQKQSSQPDVVDETPAVFTRGKGWGRPTGSSFDIKMQHVETPDEISSSADGAAADPDTIDAGQVIASHAGPVATATATRISNSQDAVGKTGATGGHSVVGKVSPVQPSQVSQPKEPDVQLQRHSENTGTPQAAVLSAKDTVSKLSKKQEAVDETKKLQLASLPDDDGIKSSGVKVDIIAAEHTLGKKSDIADMSQPAGGAQDVTTRNVRCTQHRSFGQRFCCGCCSTKE